MRKKDFLEVFGSDTVYIKSFIPEWANINGANCEVYFLDLTLLTPNQREKLIHYIVERFKQTEAFVKENLELIGFPILKSNTTIVINNPLKYMDLGDPGYEDIFDDSYTDEALEYHEDEEEF